MGLSTFYEAYYNRNNNIFLFINIILYINKIIIYNSVKWVKITLPIIIFLDRNGKKISSEMG